MNNTSSGPYWCLAAIVACIFALAQQLDAADIRSELETIAAIEEEKAALASREYVAQQICGQEGIAQWKGDELTCRTHRNHVASRQIVAEAK